MGIKITSKHKGGNITVLADNGDSFLLTPDLRDTSEQWFYWNFKVEGAEGKTVIFNFDGEFVGKWGPAISNDSFHWSFAPEKVKYDFGQKNYFKYTFGEAEKKVFFSFSLPYQLKHFNKFYNRIKANRDIERFTLIKTKQGNDVPVFIIGNNSVEHNAVLSCRHHCCESVASYFLEGLVRGLLKNEKDLACRFHILPFADLDGAEAGDQGKSRRPHDHNRDYDSAPVYPEIGAWKEYVKLLNPIIGLDFHCPWKWGYENDYIAFVYPCPQKQADELSGIYKRKTSEDPRKNTIIFSGDYNLMPGESYNIASNKTASSFYKSCGAGISLSLEIPYFGGETMYTVQNVRRAGENFAASVIENLKKL